MVINNVIFNAELGDIISELQTQLTINQIQLLQKVKDTQDNIMVACPYHKGGQERKPSMGIHKQSGVCHCFTCGTTVELQQMITHCFGYPNDMIGAFGWNWLLKNFLTISVEERKNISLDIDRGYTKKETAYVSDEELESYRYTHPYMYKRKMTDEIIEIFDIGFDKNSNCITFPVRDVFGNTLFIARRSVQSKFFNYPRDAEKPVYGLYEYTNLADKVVDFYNNRLDFTQWDKSSVIICESMIDCLYFWTIGKYAVALNGLGNELQFKQLNQMPCRKFILCTDSDEAGMKARKRIRANLKNKIVTEYILPQGRKDANDCTIEELKSLQEIF